jgi:hypothetical protein
MRAAFGARAPLAVLLLAMVVGACSPGSTPGPTIIPGPSGGSPLSQAELRLLVIQQLGPRWYCDPDEYPVAHGSEQDRAIERWPELQAEGELTRAIATRLGINLDQSVTDAEKLAIYRQWKVAQSIPLDPIGNGGYRFDYTAQPAAGATEGMRTAGTIDDQGTITVEQQATAGEPNCPICLSLGTPIDTPDGPVAVEQLRLGDPVWTLDAAGQRIAGVVIAIGSTPAPVGHHVIHLVLADGRSVTASAGHPLADGRLLADLRPGDPVDGSRVLSAETTSYGAADTYDLVASGPTGRYLAGGIPLGSTLRSAVVPSSAR